MQPAPPPIAPTPPPGSPRRAWRQRLQRALHALALPALIIPSPLGAQGARTLAAVGKGIGITVAAAMVGGAIYQAYAEARDRREFPAPGRLIAVGGERLHIDCRGDAGPTVLLDAGAGGWSLHWEALRPQVAPFTRSCAFDRPGVGWSDPSTGPFDGAALVERLHALLDSAQVDAPFVYVGHSLGGSLAQLYASRYPERVSALVLIDPGQPEDLIGGTTEEDADGRCGILCPVASFAAHVGVVRLAAGAAGSRNMSPAWNAAYRAGAARPATTRALTGIVRALPATGWQLRRASLPASVPVYVLLSDALPEPGRGESAEDVVDWRRRYLAAMDSLVARSRPGQSARVIEGTTHSSIVLAAPAVRQVAEELRLALRGELR